MYKSLAEYPNLVNQTFNRLTVTARIEPDGILTKAPKFHCSCICGQSVIVAGHVLLNGNKQSCGCLAKDARAENGRRNKLKKGNSVRNLVVGSYRRSCAANRGIECSLTEQQFDELLSGDCFYCGVPPSRTAKRGGCIGEFTYNGIDRVDNSKGYIPGNVVSCCTACNKAKMEQSVVAFLDWASQIHKRRKAILKAYRNPELIRNKGEFKP